MEAAALIGTIAAIGATSANVPQVIKTWRTGETRDLSLKMLALLTISLTLWTIYGLMRNDPIIVVSNAISAGLAAYLLWAKMRGD